MSCMHCKCTCLEKASSPINNKPLPTFVKTSERFWLSWGGVPEQYISLSDDAVKVRGIYRFRAMKVATQEAVELFPYDIGLPEFNRDGRPCVATQELSTAFNRGQQYIGWLASQKQPGRHSI